MAPGRLKGDVSRVWVSDFTSIPVLITAGRCAIPCRAHQPSEEEPHRLCDPIGVAAASCTDNTRRSRVATCERPAILAFWPSHWTRMIPQGCPARGCSSGSLRSLPTFRTRANICCATCRSNVRGRMPVRRRMPHTVYRPGARETSKWLERHEPVPSARVCIRARGQGRGRPGKKVSPHTAVGPTASADRALARARRAVS